MSLLLLLAVAGRAVASTPLVVTAPAAAPAGKATLLRAPAAPASTGPTLIASYLVTLTPQGTSTLTTPSFTPSNGEVVVVKMATWDTGSPLGAPTGGSQTFTARVINAPGGFNEWCAIYTTVISGSPGSMTISSIPSVSLRGSMLVERWSNAQLAATPVTATSTGAAAAASGTITPTSGSSVISYVIGDAQSVDPATRAYLNSATDEGMRDDHVGANGVDEYAWANSTGAGSQSYGLSLPTGMTYVTAAIEIQAVASVQATTVEPIVVTAATASPPGTAILVRNPQPGSAPPATATPQPYVVTTTQPTRPVPPILLRGSLIDLATPGPLVVTAAQAAAVPPAATILRATLADPPVLTTPSPYVVQPPAVPASPPLALQVRNPAAPVVAPATTSAQPSVVTTPGQPLPGQAQLVRSTLVDPPVLTTPGPQVITSPQPQTPAAALVVRNPQAPAAQPPAATPAPLVITTPTVTGTPAALVVRGTLADPPVLTTPSPTVITTPTAGPPAAAVIVRNPQPPAVAPATATPPPIVVTTAVAAQPGQAWLARSTLVDPPVLTTLPPLVVTTGTPRLPGAAVLIRNPQPFVPPPSGPTTRPIVVTAVLPAPPGLSVLIRGTGACDCMTHRPNTGTTVRPSSGITVRPGSGTTTRPSSGITARPSSGTTSRPCSCGGG